MTVVTHISTTVVTHIARGRDAHLYMDHAFGPYGNYCI